MKRDGLTFFPAYFECTKGMSDKQCRDFLYALADYAFEDTVPCFQNGSMEQALWVVLKPSMDKSKTFKDSGKKGGLKGGSKGGFQGGLKPTKTIDNDYDHDLGIDTGLDHDADTDTGSDVDTYVSTEKKKEKKEKFSPPTVEQVREYCAERNNYVDPEAFIAYYESQGWRKANGTKVVDWKGCVRTWEARDNGYFKKDRQADQRKDEPWHWTPITAEVYDA